MAYRDFHLYMDDVETGQAWTSPARTVTEADIVNFAGLSGDFNPIHVDHEFARSTPFGKPIAHGLLVVSMASGLALNTPPMRTLAFVGIQSWQFLEPVFVGDTIHIRTSLVEKEIRARGRRALITWRREVINQQEKIVQQGLTVTLVEGRANSKGNED